MIALTLTSARNKVIMQKHRVLPASFNTTDVYYANILNAAIFILPNAAFYQCVVLPVYVRLALVANVPDTSWC